MPTAPLPTATDAQVGRSLRAVRTAAGLKQTDLSREIAARGVTVHNSLVSQVEHGHRRLYFTEALAIADALGIEVQALADYERVAAEREVAELRARLAELEERLSGGAAA